MVGLNITNKQWVQIQIPAGLHYIIPQNNSSFYYSEKQQTDIIAPYKNNEIKTFSSNISINKNTQSSLYVLSVKDEGKLIIEDSFNAI